MHVLRHMLRLMLGTCSVLRHTVLHGVAQG